MATWRPAIESSPSPVVGKASPAAAATNTATRGDFMAADGAAPTPPPQPPPTPAPPSAPPPTSIPATRPTAPHRQHLQGSPIFHHHHQQHQHQQQPLGLHQQGYHPRGLSLTLHQQQGMPASTSRAPPKQVAAPPGTSPRSGSGAATAIVTAAGGDGERCGGGGGGSAGHSRDDAWTESATVALIDAWGERYLQLNRGNLKQKHWREVADEVNRRVTMDDGKTTSNCGKTDVQCKNRLDTLKKKYKIEKARFMSEGSPSKWAFFVRLDELVGPSKKGKKKVQGGSGNGNGNGSGLPPAASLLPPAFLPRQQAQIHRLDDSKVQQQHQQPPPPPPQQGTSNSSSSKESAGMSDSCENHHHHHNQQQQHHHHGNAMNNGSTVDGKPSRKRKLEGPFKDLARAIIKFGEVYERIESAKQQQLMDLERQRMEFIKELELQRMQLFMQTQVELAKMKHAKHGNTEHYL